ncbi:ATP-binding protein [Kitasatospora sp. NPDC088346]|uniref:ATP-binding protein n=1 Tax=Kitasatospora sp. NPDC088346 TaxID=3364073 RepID=UPI003814D0C2
MTTVHPTPVQTPAPPCRGADAALLGWTEPFTDRPQCVTEVRAHARSFLARARLCGAERDDALLVLSELVTNSIRHAHGPGTLRLTAGPDGIGIDVSDGSRLMPTPRLTDPGRDTGGLGLHLVAVLCDSFSVTLDAGSGKTVHAHLPHPDARPAAHPAAHPRGDDAPRDGRTHHW